MDQYHKFLRNASLSLMVINPPNWIPKTAHPRSVYYVWNLKTTSDSYIYPLTSLRSKVMSSNFESNYLFALVNLQINDTQCFPLF